jgi:hypothetical protein
MEAQRIQKRRAADLASVRVAGGGGRAALTGGGERGAARMTLKA